MDTGRTSGGLPAWSTALLGLVQHPEWYRDELLASQGRAVVLSVWQPPQPRSAVVFVPGTAVHPLFYAQFLDLLAAGGCAVVGLHPEGHGKSPRLRRTLRWDALVGNTADAVAWARARWGLPVVLMGSSQGSLVALMAAAQGAEVAGVVAHNVFDPASPAVVSATRFAAFRWTHRPVQAAVAAAARVVPRLPVPVFAYLDRSRVFHDPAVAARCDADPLTVRAYPLRFLADLMTVDTAALFDGRLQVPVAVVTARGDPLFPLADTRELVDRIAAPETRLVVIDADCHLILNELPRDSADVVLDTLRGWLDRAAPSAAAGATG